MPANQSVLLDIYSVQLKNVPLLIMHKIVRLNLEGCPPPKDKPPPLKDKPRWLRTELACHDG